MNDNVAIHECMNSYYTCVTSITSIITAHEIWSISPFTHTYTYKAHQRGQSYDNSAYIFRQGFKVEPKFWKQFSSNCRCICRNHAIIHCVLRALSQITELAIPTLHSNYLLPRAHAQGVIKAIVNMCTNLTRSGVLHAM